MIYKYNCINEECEKFQEVIEISHPMAEDSRTQCDVCNTDKLRKVYSASPIRLKGSGWFGSNHAKIT